MFWQDRSLSHHSGFHPARYSISLSFLQLLTPSNSMEMKDVWIEYYLKFILKQALTIHKRKLNSSEKQKNQGIKFKAMNEKIDTILFPRILSKNSISVLKHHTIFKIQCKQRLLQSSNNNVQSPERPTK